MRAGGQGDRKRIRDRIYTGVWMAVTRRTRWPEQPFRDAWELLRQPVEDGVNEQPGLAVLWTVQDEAGQGGERR